jgi:hypothetical protein
LRTLQQPVQKRVFQQAVTGVNDLALKRYAWSNRSQMQHFEMNLDF